MKTDDRMVDLPGGILVQQGLSDLNRGRRTIPASLVEIARTRFVRAGLLPERKKFTRRGGAEPPVEAELQLYRLLRAEGGDAYSRYNALLRELISFEQALERQG